MPYIKVGKENSSDIEIEIYYKDWGSGQPVVFSHRWPLSADDWEGQMFYLGIARLSLHRLRPSRSRPLKPAMERQ